MTKMSKKTTLTPFVCESPHCDALVNPLLYFGDEGPLYRDMGDITYCGGCLSIIKFKEEQSGE